MRRGSGWYALALLAAINLLNFIDRNVIFALFEPIKRDLSLSDTQLGWLGSAYIFVFSFAALPFGVISDLRSRRAVIAGGVTLWSAFTFLSGLVTSFWQLFTCRAAVGIGEAAYGPAANSMVADYFPGRGRAVAMGILSSGIALGGVLGLILGGFLESLYGWRVAFMVVGVPGFVCAILVMRLYDPGRTPAEIAARASATPFGGSLSGTLTEMMRAGKIVRHTPTLVYMFIAGALISFGINGIVGWGPTFVARELELTSHQAAVLLGKWGLIAGTTGTLFGGFFADWLRRYFEAARVITVAAGLLIGGPLAVWLLTIRDPVLFQIVFFAAFFCLSWYNGPTNAVIFDVVPPRVSATVAGAYLLFIHLAGDAIALPLVGALSDEFGLDRAVLLLPSLVIVGGLVVLGALRTLGPDMRRIAAATAAGSQSS